MKPRILRNKEDQDRLARAMLNAEFVHPLEVTVKPYSPTRSIEQNAKMWALLTDLSKQVVLTQDGYKHISEAQGWTRKLSPEDYKDVTTAVLRGQDTVPGLDQGFVLIGGRTSKMTTNEMMDLIEFIQAFGASKGVEWSEEV